MSESVLLKRRDKYVRIYSPRLLTVQSRLGGGITLSGIFEAATTICPICKVYPPNICTHDGGSQGPSSGELGTLF